EDRARGALGSADYAGVFEIAADQREVTRFSAEHRAERRREDERADGEKGWLHDKTESKQVVCLRFGDSIGVTRPSQSGVHPEGAARNYFSSVYFADEPRAFSTGYFASFRAIFRSMASSRLMPRLSASSSRYTSTSAISWAA